MAFSNLLRGAVHADALFWIEARNVQTGDPETLGVWTGSFDRQFEIDGETRPYVGAGGFLTIGNLMTRIGLFVQRQTVELSGLKPEIKNLLNGYDARQAPVELHSLRRDPETNEITAIDPIFKGWLNKAPSTVGQLGGKAKIKCQCVSSARLLTKKLALVKSDAIQSQQGDDEFMKYADVSGNAEVFWGMERIKT